MPRGSGYAHPSDSGESLDRDTSLAPVAAQSQAPPLGGSEPAQSQILPRRPCVSFDASAGPSVVSPDGEEEEEEDDQDSVVSASPVLGKTFARLISFIYEQYPKSRPLSSPLPPRCGFETLFAVADPPGSSRL